MQTDLTVEQTSPETTFKVVRGGCVLGEGDTKDDARRVRFELAKAEARYGKRTLEALNAARRNIPAKCRGWLF
jgi:hypothetical protein